jgi:hypothetical protein
MGAVWLVVSLYTDSRYWYVSYIIKTNKKQTPWPQSTSELYRPSDRRLLAKLVPNVADRECHVVSVTDPYCRILAFLDGAATFLSSSTSVVITRLSGPRSSPTTSQKMW